MGAVTLKHATYEDRVKWYARIKELITERPHIDIPCLRLKLMGEGLDVAEPTLYRYRRLINAGEDITDHRLAGAEHVKGSHEPPEPEPLPRPLPPGPLPAEVKQAEEDTRHLSLLVKFICAVEALGGADKARRVLNKYLDIKDIIDGLHTATNSEATARAAVRLADTLADNGEGL